MPGHGRLMTRISAGAFGDRLPFHVDDLSDDAGKWSSRGAGLRRDRAGNGA